MMCPTERVLADLCDTEKLLLLLSLDNLPILWLVLRALVMLSERSEMVRVVQLLLPEVMETLQYDNTHITEKALTVFENVIGHLEKREASPIALALAERLLPLFNNVSSEVRERSMLLFQDLMESVVWWKKGAMKTTVRRALIPLLFRMSDETQSVAKASAVVLLACAKFLKWKQLEQLTQTEDIWRIWEYLLKQKISRVEGCLPYLEDAQANLRQEAVKFIGEPRPHFPVWALPWQQGAALWALKPLIVAPGALCLPQPPAHAGGPGVCLAQVPPWAPCLQGCWGQGGRAQPCLYQGL
nr:maestro heat-like repeat-containing protein family member 7 isoform X6 [Anser cygnoides]